MRKDKDGHAQREEAAEGAKAQENEAKKRAETRNDDARVTV